MRYNTLLHCLPVKEMSSHLENEQKEGKKNEAELIASSCAQ